MIRRGEVFWVDFGVPVGSEPGYRRPVVVVQSDDFNRSRIRTVLCAILTSNLDLAQAPGNFVLAGEAAGLGKVSVVNVSQLYTVDKAALGESTGHLKGNDLARLNQGLRLVLDL